MVVLPASWPRDAPEVLPPGEHVRAREAGKSTAVIAMPVIFLL